MTRPGTLLRSRLATVALFALVASLYGGALYGQAALPPSEPPADWGAVSINLEDVPYPHPVQFLERTLFGQDVRLAYMDVAPVGEPNGRTVVLLHGGSYYGWYWKDTIEALRNEGWKPEFLEHVRIRYGNALSGEWPRLNLVRSMAGNARSIDTIVHDWPQMATRALVIGGAEDGPNFPEIARNGANAPQNAELVLIPNVGHNPHLEAPEIFNRELIRFLGSDRGALATER